MKKAPVFAALLIALFVQTPSFAQAPQSPGSNPTVKTGVRRALLVGIDYYDPYYGPGSLPSCVNDAIGTRDIMMLADPSGRWPAGNLITLTDGMANKAAIRNCLAGMASQSGPGDLVVYYHSSHGGSNGGYSTYLCSYNADYTDAELGSDLAHFNSGTYVVVIVDACYSGGLFKETGWPFIQRVMEEYQQAKIARLQADGLPIPESLGANIAFLTACDYDEFSNAGPTYSLYAGYLIEACNVAGADANRDGEYSFLELHWYADPLTIADDPYQDAQSYNEGLLNSLAARAAGAPSVHNDDFAQRIALSGERGSATGSNIGASKEPGEPNHAYSAGGASVWWTWTAPASGLTTIDTRNSNFDTLLAVYTGWAVNSLTRIASNDDYYNLQSRVQFTATAGTAYQIAVDGYSGRTGSIVLNWEGASLPPPSPPTGVDARTGTARGQILLQWNAVAGATSYKIHYDEDSYNPPFSPNYSGYPACGTNVGNIRSIAISNLPAGQTYYCAVTAVNAVGDSNYSSQDSAAAAVAASSSPPVAFRVVYNDESGFRLPLPSGYQGRGSIHIGDGRSALNGTDFYGNQLNNGWLGMDYRSDQIASPPVLFLACYNDETCLWRPIPSGYSGRGSIHVGRGAPVLNGSDFYGNCLNNGWMALCYKTSQLQYPPVLFAIAWNDDTQSRPLPYPPVIGPYRYVERGSIHVGCGRPVLTASDFFARGVNNGWLGLCYRSDYVSQNARGAFVLFEPETLVRLNGVSAAVNSADDDEVMFAVYDCASGFTTSTLVACTYGVAVKPGAGDCVSPPMNVWLEPGRLYAVGLEWNGAVEMATLPLGEMLATEDALGTSKDGFLVGRASFDLGKGTTQPMSPDAVDLKNVYPIRLDLADRE